MSQALSKRWLRAEIERERRRAVRERLAELKGLIVAARRGKRERIALIRVQCRRARKRLRETCIGRASRARSEGRAEIATRRAQLASAELGERLEREAIRGGRGARMGNTRSSALEARAESDDEVRGNIEASLVPVFDRIRRSVKGSANRSRTEAFLQWAEENPGEIYAMQQQQADRELAKLIQEQSRLQSGRAARSSYVPF